MAKVFDAAEGSSFCVLRLLLYLFIQTHCSLPISCHSIHHHAQTHTKQYPTVAQHASPESCWVILYNNVYDVTSFLQQHPGGQKVILQLAGLDATEEYDPVHPPGTLEQYLPPSAKLGTVDPSTLPQPTSKSTSSSPTVATSVSSSSSSLHQESKEDIDAIDVNDLLNLDEIEELATKKVSKKAWAYYYSASDDLFSKSYNNAVYRSILLRPRVFVDCTSCSLQTTLLGSIKVQTPIFVSPAAMARLAHPSGEHGIATAMSNFGGVQIISNNASMSPEQILEGSPRGQVFGWQLYVQNTRKTSEDMLRRINLLSKPTGVVKGKDGKEERGHIGFIVLTLDAPVPGKREDDERQGRMGAQTRVPSKIVAEKESEKPKKGGGVGQALFFGTAADLTWEATLAWLTKHTSLPIVLKGIQTHDDALLALRYSKRYKQLKGIILSNHGGRAADTAPPSIHTLLEIRKYAPEVLRSVEHGGLDVWLDGGIKRGTDVVKALCLGAKAVGIGRAALWGLGAGGEEGVKRVLEILNGESETCMRLLGVKDVSRLGVRCVNARRVEKDIFDGGRLEEDGKLWVKSNL